jgi:hypothetical protein
LLVQFRAFVQKGRRSFALGDHPPRQVNPSEQIENQFLIYIC